MEKRFKIGDRVEVVKCFDKVAEHVGKCGTYAGFVGSTRVVNLDSGDNCYATAISAVELLAKTWDTLAVDDVLVSNYGDERSVLATCGKVVALGYSNNSTNHEDWYSKEQLQNRGYTIKGTFPEPQAMTLAEISKELGRPIKIKE